LGSEVKPAKKGGVGRVLSRFGFNSH